MKIYQINRTNDWEYDEYNGFVVAAVNEIQAHNIANAKCGDYSNWLDHHSETIEIGQYTGPAKEPFIVLSSFNAG